MKKLILFILLVGLMLSTGCDLITTSKSQVDNEPSTTASGSSADASSSEVTVTEVPIETPTETPIETPKPTKTPKPTPKPTKTPKPTPKPTKTPKPTPKQEGKASIGFVGDVLMMESQIRHAQTKSGYDFTPSFEPMRQFFNSVDLMCANLEGPLAGKAAEYTKPYSDPSNAVCQSFNAPDALAYNLKDLGVDVLTTANNHCLDRGLKGLYRTLDVLDKAGIQHTGTFRNDEDRNKLLIFDLNGIKVGILAYSSVFNKRSEITSKQWTALANLDDEHIVKEKIQQLRAAGAEYIILITHCGIELTHEPRSREVEQFERMIGYGADAIISSHPHYVQPIEVKTITREDGTVVKAPIVYSLGNFISNMYPSPKNYGLYVSLDLERDADGNVVFGDIDYIPVICLRQATSKGTLHQTIPCYSKQDNITAFEPLSRADLAECEKCRKYVIKICGKKYVNKLCK